MRIVEKTKRKKNENLGTSLANNACAHTYVCVLKGRKNREFHVPLSFFYSTRVSLATWVHSWKEKNEA